MYSAPEKLHDGRLFVKIDPAHYVQLQSVTVGELSSTETIVHGDMSKIIQEDSRIIDDAVTNSTSWFGKEWSREQLQNYYQSSIDDSSLQVQTGTPTFFTPSKEHSKVPPSSGSICSVLLQLEGLWFLKRSFGPMWKLVQVRERKKVEPVKCLIDDSDDE
jgi:hypothetical protein